MWTTTTRVDIESIEFMMQTTLQTCQSRRDHHPDAKAEDTILTKWIVKTGPS
jgi:hypothetical protein